MEGPRAEVTSDLRHFLRGRWELRRTIRDHRADRSGTFRGWALFESRAEDLLYREEGELRLGPHRGRAKRLYLFSFPSPERALVRFSDGRAFHELCFSGGLCEVSHRCGRDDYRALFRAVGAGRWEVRWCIRGPQKDMILTTVYSK